jgi:hypothetical protein
MRKIKNSDTEVINDGAELKDRSGHGSASDLAPRTGLGRRLLQIREHIVESGQPLLDWDELEREMLERRGGLANQEE